jgi:hypothetical protein
MKTFIIIVISAALAACSITPSKPKSPTSKLRSNQGAVILSTVGEESSSEFGTGFVNVANEVISLGLASETRVLQIAFTSDTQERNKKNSFVLGHSYKTSGSASTKKWHIVPVEAGSYYISHVMYEDYVGVKRRTSLPKNLFSFEVSQGEWVYLGSLVTALKEMKATSKYTSTQYARSSSHSTNTVTELPVIADINWDESEARRQAGYYVNYPDKFRVVEYDEEKLNVYRDRIDQLSSQ